MAKSFFNWIGDRLNKTLYEQPEENNVLDKTGIDTEENVQDKILKAFLSLFNSAYKGRKSDMGDKIFTLWITDQLLFEVINKSDFQDKLITRLDEEGYRNTIWNSVRFENPPQGHLFTAIIADKVFLQIETQEFVKPTISKARITVIPSKGSLLQEEYLLNSEERQRYNIGVGIFPDMQGKGVRENHIAIDDNINSLQYENNKYVSSAHAHIGFSHKYGGFYLQVELGGSRPFSNNRTQIFRGDKDPIEVENTVLPESLQNGDFIVLGKSVTLRFEEV